MLSISDATSIHSILTHLLLLLLAGLPRTRCRTIYETLNSARTLSDNICLKTFLRSWY